MVNMVVISVKFSIEQCLNYLSSMHSLSASVKGSWLFLNRFLCSTSYPPNKHIYMCSIYMCVQWCSIYMCVQWCSIYMCVQWCSIYMCVQWCSIYMCVQWCSIYMCVQWCSIYMCVQWCSIYTCVQWCSIYVLYVHEYVTLTSEYHNRIKLRFLFPLMAGLQSHTHAKWMPSVSMMWHMHQHELCCHSYMNKKRVHNEIVVRWGGMRGCSGEVGWYGRM